MDRALAPYVRHHRAEGSSEHTIKFHQEGAGGFIRWSSRKGYPTAIEDLDADHVREWVAELRNRG